MGITVDSVELIIEGTWNARDSATLAGVQQGFLFRSAALQRVTDSGRATLADLGVTDVIDLRSEMEVDSQGADAVPDSVTVHNLPITPGRSLAQGLMKDGKPDEQVLERLVGLLHTPGWAQGFMDDIYRELVTEPAAVAQLGAALRVMSEAEGAVVVHCSAGKDRTGVLTSLACTIAGADDDAIREDFLYSNRAIASQSTSIPPLPGVNREQLLPFLGVRAESLAFAWQTLDETYGGLSGFLDAAGVDAEVAGTLRERLSVR
jgi:protein-tyrosine phosphatase